MFSCLQLTKHVEYYMERQGEAFGIGGVVQVKGSPTPQLKSGGDPVQVKGGQADE